MRTSTLAAGLARSLLTCTIRGPGFYAFVVAKYLVKQKLPDDDFAGAPLKHIQNLCYLPLETNLSNRDLG